MGFIYSMGVTTELQKQLSIYLHYLMDVADIWHALHYTKLTLALQPPPASYRTMFAQLKSKHYPLSYNDSLGNTEERIIKHIHYTKTEDKG